MPCLCLLLLTIPVFGPLQLMASILMIANNTENDTANVKVFGAFIIIMDIIATVLSAVYGVEFCYQDNNKRKIQNCRMPTRVLIQVKN